MASGPNSNATLLIVLEAQSQKLQNQLVDVTKQIDRFAAQTEKRFAQMNAANAASFDKLGAQVQGSLGGIEKALAALGLGVGIKQVLQYADAWLTAENKLKSASQYSGLQARSLDAITDAANGARTPLSDYVTLYSRILNTAGNLHLTELQVAAATDIVSKAFKVGGATAQEQAAGITQITQALGAGVVQGQDLRAIKNDAPIIAQALASFFKTTVGGLKALGAQGKITSQDFLDAMLAYQSKIDAAFNSTSSTINDAVTKIENSFERFVGTQGQATGAIEKLIEALTWLSDNFGKVAPIVADFVAIIGGALATKALVGFAGAIGEATYALGAFLASMAAGEVTMAGLAAAMGPIALLIGAAATAFFVLRNSTDQVDASLTTLNADIATNADKLKIAQSASAAYRADLQKQIAVQIQAAEAALEEAGAQYQVAQAKKAARAALPQATQGFYSMLDGVTGNAFGTDPDADSQAALDQINKARAALTKLKGQQNLVSWQDYMTPGTSDQAKGDGNDPPGSTKTKGNAYSSAAQSIQKQTDALNAQTDAQSKLNPLVNDYGYAVTKAKTASDLLSDAEKAGIKITPDLRAAIDKLASGYAAAGVAAQKLTNDQDQLKAEVDGFRDAAKDGMKSFIDDLVQGKSAVEAIGDALSSVGNYIEQMGLDALFGGGSTSNKNSPLGLIGQLFGFANGGIASHGRPQTFANGGVSNSASIFGEAGPEAAVPLPDGRRIPVDLRMPSAANDNGGIRVSMPISIDAAGADPAALARLTAAVQQMKSDLPNSVIAGVRQAKRRRQL